MLCSQEDTATGVAVSPDGRSLYVTLRTLVERNRQGRGALINGIFETQSPILAILSIGLHAGESHEVGEELLEHSPASLVRWPRLNYESRATTGNVRDVTIRVMSA
jgi:hypothetical protein